MSKELNYLSKIRKIPSILLGIFAFTLLVTTQLQKQDLSKIPKNLIAPPTAIEHFSFGFQEAMSDVFWIRTLQDFDYCEKEEAKNVCMNNSWLFKMLDAITNLSPNFRIAYAAGGIALSILITDIDGATRIFDKGVAAFPKDWPILYRAAYHYIYEVKNNERAAELLIMAGHNGAPPWVFSLAGRLYTEAGRLDLARLTLNQMIREERDPAIIKRLQDKLNSIENKK